MSIPVLMYHAIGEASSGTQEFDDGDFTVSESRFREHLRYLREHGYTTCLLSQLKWIDAVDKRVIITFDDGHASDVDVALPLLQEFGFNAEFFVTTAWVGQPGYVDAAGIEALSRAGMGIGSHGHSHRFFNDLSYDEAEEELQESLHLLRTLAVQPVASFSAPGGQLPAQLSKLCEKLGLQYVCTSATGLYEQRHFPFSIPRIAIRKDLAMEDFVRMVSGDARFFRQLKWRSAVLSGIRRTVGNDLYMNVRERVLTRRQAR